MDEAAPIRPIRPIRPRPLPRPPGAYGAPRGAQMALAAPAPLPAAGAAPRSRVVITEELGDVLETPVGPGEAMLVRAVAGAGKSTMLELRARRNPIQKFLYLAYNDSVAEEMSQRFAIYISIQHSHPVLRAPQAHRASSLANDAARARMSRYQVARTTFLTGTHPPQYLYEPPRKARMPRLAR